MGVGRIGERKVSTLPHVSVGEMDGMLFLAVRPQCPPTEMVFGYCVRNPDGEMSVLSGLDYSEKFLASLYQR